MSTDPTLFCIYFSPTTPGAASFAVDVTGAIRLGSITGLVGEAELGAVGEGNIVLDDPLSTIGHMGDGIVGLKQMYFNEMACPSGNRRLWTGYIGDRRYHRGQGDSLRTGAARKIDVSLEDLNSFLSFRVFAPTAEDPTSDFVRPAETDLERIAAMLTTVDFLSTTLFDIGYIPTTGGVALDANDYTGQRPADVLNDCAQASGRNFWVKYDEASGHLVLWYDTWDTDGSATKTYDSALMLTNVLAEVNGTTIFADDMNAVEVLDPSRVVSAVYLPFDNKTDSPAYRTLPATANTFAWRDMIAPSVSVKTLTKANALADRYLAENSTEASRISCTVQLPREYVTGIHEGMRLQVHFTHLPNVSEGFTWTRVLQRTIRQDVETQFYYWLDLELTPLPKSCIIQFGTECNTSGGCQNYNWDTPPTNGNLIIGALVQRGGSTFDATIVPIGTTDPTPICNPLHDIGGTDWTFIDGIPTWVDAGGTYPITMAYRQAGANEPQFIRWGGTGGGLGGGTGPRSHQVEVACDMSGAPDVTASSQYQTTAGSVFTTASIAAPAAGYIFWLLSYGAPGPGDGFSAPFVLTPRSPAVLLTAGYNGGTGGVPDRAPYSAFGYLKVDAAGTYSVTLDRSAVPRNPTNQYGSMLAFWAT